MKKFQIKYLFSIGMICAALISTPFLLNGCGNENADELPLGEVNEAPSDLGDQNLPEEITDTEPEAAEEDAAEGEEDGILPVIETRKTVNGKIQSYLTGEWIDEKIGTRRPIAVMIPNNAPAMPQYGLSKAAIIYEAPVEGRITRLMEVFEDYDELSHIGPVRSRRDYFV